jgi:hypothetical protein
MNRPGSARLLEPCGFSLLLTWTSDLSEVTGAGFCRSGRPGHKEMEERRFRSLIDHWLGRFQSYVWALGTLVWKLPWEAF